MHARRARLYSNLVANLAWMHARGPARGARSRAVAQEGGALSPRPTPNGSPTTRYGCWALIWHLGGLSRRLDLSGLPV